MPDLPTMTVTDVQADRILSAYRDKFNTTTTAETAEAYRKWLKEQVVATVLAFEREKLQQEAEVAVENQLAEIRKDLPDPPPDPVDPTPEEVERQALITAQLNSINPEGLTG